MIEEPLKLEPALLETVGGLAHLAALLVLGLAASRLGGAWQRGLPLLLLAALLPGLVLGHVSPGLQALAGWGVLAALWMTGLLVALPRPHSAPSAIVATLLLGLAHGHAGGVAAQDGGAALMVFMLMSLGWVAIGAAVGALATRHHDADRRFVLFGASSCVLGVLVAGLLPR
jgi:hydrogenase/urease accessory protein HupE